MTTFKQVLFKKIIPLGFIVGVGIETFMYYTGFWNVATRKEAERYIEREERRKEFDSMKDSGTSPILNIPQQKPLK